MIAYGENPARDSEWGCARMGGSREHGLGQAHTNRGAARAPALAGRECEEKQRTKAPRRS